MRREPGAGEFVQTWKHWAGEFINWTNVSSYSAVTPNDPDQLKAAIAERVTSVAIEADTMYFQTYTSGVLTDAAHDLPAQRHCAQ